MTWNFCKINTEIAFNNKSHYYGSKLECYSLTDTRNNRHPGWKRGLYDEAKWIKGGNNPVYKQKKLQASTSYKDTTFISDMLKYCI
jgi:hypothetical protein